MCLIFSSKEYTSRIPLDFWMCVQQFMNFCHKKEIIMWQKFIFLATVNTPRIIKKIEDVSNNVASFVCQLALVVLSKSSSIFHFAVPMQLQDCMVHCIEFVWIFDWWYIVNDYKKPKWKDIKGNTIMNWHTKLVYVLVWVRASESLH